MFSGGDIFLFVVAGFATRDDVGLHGFSPTRDGNHMVHREILASDLLTAIMADALLQLGSPPIGFA